MRLLRVGRWALLVELADLSETRAWYAELLRRRSSGELARDVEIVPAARTVLLDGLTDATSTAARLQTWPEPAEVPEQAAALVEVPTRYDGPDLAEVAGRWGVSVPEAVEIHAGTGFVVAFCGFAPGFAYLAGLPSSREVPRLATPRARVPAGSVGLAGPYCGIYPGESPGGWQLIGRTDAVLWDLGRPVPALLVPGTRVRFTVQQ